MPSFRILLFSMLVFTFCDSCSSDDDTPEVALEDLALSFADSLRWIHHPPPIRLWDGDINATQAVDYLDFANSVMLMNVRRHLTPSQWTDELVQEPVVGKPGVKYRTHTWIVYNVGQYASQVSKQGGRYVFEGFFRNWETWRPVVFAEEYPDRSRGLMKVYAGDEVSTQATWERHNDRFYLVLKYPAAMYQELHLDIDEKTGAGTVQHWQDEQHLYDVTWDALGDGNWIQYNADGSVYAAGNWEVE